MPRPTPSWRRYLRFRGADARADVDDELTFHIELVAQSYIESGDSPESAQRRARDEFGDVDHARSECYRIGDRRRRRNARGELLTALRQDFHFALRALRASPAFTAGVALMMGLAIAAMSAMFAVVDPLFVRRPAFLREPGTVHRIYENTDNFFGDPGPISMFSVGQFADLRRWTRAFSDIAAFSERDAVVTTNGRTELTRVVTASATVWRLFDVQPLLGRFFVGAEDTGDASADIAVISYDFWHTRFASDPYVVGQSFAIGGSMRRIIGVAPRGFVGLSTGSPVAWIPILQNPFEQFTPREPSGIERYNSRWLEVVARQRRNWTDAAATADLSAALHRSFAVQRGLRAVAVSGGPQPFDDGAAGMLAPVLRQQGPLRTDEARVALWLAALSAVVLLVAALNVANLMLARTLRRQREIAVRLALGATLGRLIRLLFAESLLLMCAGAAVGLTAVAWVGDVARQRLLPHVNLPAIVLTPRITVFTLLAAVAVAAVVAVAPAVHARGWNVRSAINDSARGGSLRRSRLRTAMLVTQAALSLALCVGAGLFVRSLYNIRALPLGYVPRGVLVVTPVGAATDATSRRALMNAVAARLRARPDAPDVAQSIALPFGVSMRRNLNVPGSDSVAAGESMFLYNAVSPEYFSVVGTKIVDGRGFAAADSVSAERVIVVSAPMAARLWPSQRAIGRCVKFPRSDDGCARVVGVSEGTRVVSYQRDAMLQYYVPLAQLPALSAISVLIRARGSTTLAAQRIANQIADLAPNGVVLRVTAMQDGLDRAAASWRVGSILLSGFALLALIVATLGVYAAVNFDLVEREYEIGIRLALGATRRDLVRGAMRHGARVAALGVVAGTMLALGIGSAISALLFGVSSRDPATFIAGGVAITAAFLIASVFPALRAARADPALILRSG